MRFLRLLLLAVFILGLGAIYAGYEVFRRYAAFGNEIVLDIPRGTSTQQIAGMLRTAGVIEREWPFLLVRLFRHGRTLQAGEYRFQHPASAVEVYDRLVRGDIYYHEISVPEGRNIFDIATLVEQMGLIPAAEFLKVARDPSLIRDIDPLAPSLEGYLFPETYRVPRRTTAKQLCQIMTGRFREVWSGLKTGSEVHRTVTLASLVEKEGKVPEERPLIAAVFLRRLDLGMRLDCDPTTIYAALLEKRYRGTIYKSDLESLNPYNTYRHAGLPPGPIANPGLASIRAVLNPAESDALYFVLKPDGSGGHTFSNNFASHNAAIEKYRDALPR